MSSIPKEQTELYIRKDRGGTRRWYQWLAHLIRTTRWPGMTTAEDDTCGVDCECGEHIFISSSAIYWCPKCHRGYMTDFRVFRFPVWMYALRKRAYVPPTSKYRALMDDFYKQHPGLRPHYMDDMP